MASDGIRKLTAILNADAVGYSRLLAEDEVGTVQQLKSYRELIGVRVREHHGRVVDSPGDNILAEFPSALDAVRCAVEIQRVLKTRNDDLPDNRKMEFRIGIHLGDVMVDGERIYGDGVNIAARLEGLADPGGICISATIFEQVRNKLDFNYKDIGPQEVKNISNPVQAYKIISPSRISDPTKSEPKRISRKAVSALAIIILLCVGLVVIWSYFLQTKVPQEQAAKTETTIAPAEKPSIAVLPFENMSGDPEQEYFSDGMTEEIINLLSKSSQLFVISRNSTFTYKGRAVKAQQVGEELGAKYVLEGSVRKAGARIRITAQLIDATTGNHIWSEKYDRELKDVFALQDYVAQQITVALNVEVEGTERSRIRAIPTDNLTAYESLLRGIEYYWRITKAENARARELFERAIELDPMYTEAYIWLGRTYYEDYNLSWNRDIKELDEAFVLAQKAISLDNTHPRAHRLLSDVYRLRGQLKLAFAEANKALSFDPNDDAMYYSMSATLRQMDKPKKALESIEKAMKLNPYYPAPYALRLAAIHGYLGRYDEAIIMGNQALTLNPNWDLIYWRLSSYYVLQWIFQQSNNAYNIDRALELAQKAAELSDSLLEGNQGLWYVYQWGMQFEKAIAIAEKMIELAPEVYPGYVSLAGTLNYVGKPEEAIDILEKSKHITGGLVLRLITLGISYRLLARYEEGIEIQKQVLTLNPSFYSRFMTHKELTILYAELDRVEEARAEAAELMKLAPNFSAKAYGERMHFKDPTQTERDMVALRKAGLPN